MSGLRVAFDVFPTFRYAWRALLKKPGDTLWAMTTIGLGILGVVLAFSLIYGSVLRGIPFADPDRLAHLVRVEGGKTDGEVDAATVLAWQRNDDLFSGVAAFYTGTVNLSGGEVPERFDGAFVSTNLLEVLGVEPALGSGFSPQVGAPERRGEILLSDLVWHQHFGGDPDVVGQRLRVNGRSAEVVGVMPPGFRFPRQQELWVPLPVLDGASGESLGDTETFEEQELREEGAEVEDGVVVEDGEVLESDVSLVVFARLQPGVDREAASAAMAARAVSEANRVAARLDPLIDWFMPLEVRQFFYLLWVGGACVLLIACANVTSLLLARASVQEHEIATRLALGASREQILWDRLAEGLLIAAGGGILSAVLLYGFDIFMGAEAMQQEQVPTWSDTRGDPTVPAVHLGVTLAAGLLAALLPALQAARGEVARILKDRSRHLSSFRISRFHRSLVVFEVAVACALLLSAGLMVRTVLALDGVDVEDGDRMLTARFGLFESRYPDAASRQQFYTELEDALKDLPGSEAVVLTSNLPTAGLDGTGLVLRSDPPETPRGANLGVVSPGYFEMFQIPLLAGRLFDSGDTAEAPPVAIVNSSFVVGAWPEGDALGQELRLQTPEGETVWQTVVGVVPDAFLERLGDDDPRGLYLPLQQVDRRFLSLAVRTEGDPMALADPLRQAVAEIDPDLPLYWVRTMDSLVTERRFFYDLFGGLCVFLGGTAILLAAFGVYGVMAFVVGQRAQEIGIHLALGARPGQVLRLLIRQALGRLVWGLPVGILGGVLGGRVLRGYLYNVEPLDPVTFIAAPLLVMAIVLLACWLPTRRLLRRPPMDVLRSD